jgi:hypothetical protein
MHWSATTEQLTATILGARYAQAVWPKTLIQLEIRSKVQATLETRIVDRSVFLFASDG